MQEVKHYPPGTFSWIDLGTTDAAAAKQFYGQLFGWQAHDMPAGQGMTYTMFTLEGLSVAGMYEMAGEQRAQGVPPHWMSYISVADIQATAAQVAGLGGTLAAEPMEVRGEGQPEASGHMAMVQDPTGAMFALWQPEQHIGAQLVNIPHTFSWNELATRDLEKAMAFYRGLFGWEMQTHAMPNGPYTTLSNQGRMGGGMMQMTEEWGDIPPAWSVYFVVEDCDAALTRAQELGATVLVPVTAIPPAGRFAVLQDPQGAVFNVMDGDKFDPPPGYDA